MAISKKSTSKKATKKTVARKFRSSKSTNTSGSSRLLMDALALANTLVNSQKEQGMEKLGFLIERTRDYASSLKAMPIIRDQIDYVADSLSQFSDYIVTTKLDKIALDAKKFAGRNPVLTISLTTIMGLAAIGLVTAKITMPTEKWVVRGRSTTKKGSKLANGTRSRPNGHAQLPN
jgi:hypothetical protein